MNKIPYDFAGWATRNNLKCSDGRTVRKDAFKHNHGMTVPLVWNHQHDDSFNVLGHALLENRDEGVYAYCTLNETEAGRNAKLLIEHGDVSALSIYANQLKQRGGDVLHGAIREISLVLAGANPGAFIDDVIRHGAVYDEEAYIYTGEYIILSHSDKQAKEKNEEEKDGKESEDEETISEIFDTLSEKQKKVVCAMVGQALEKRETDEDDVGNQNKDSKGETESMKHNIFDREDAQEDVLSHADTKAIFADVKRYGSLRDSVLAHGIENIDYLFPDAKTVTNDPQFITRDMNWVKKVMSATHHTPFSRIKSVLADITEDDARAKGYIKGNAKKDEVFSLLKRTTSPTTVYKKQKLDRDDVVDIVDFNVVAGLKSEMRMMLDEELARAILIGDGRISSSDDKINEQNIRPIWKDDDLYTIKTRVEITNGEPRAKAFIRAAIKARKNYKGSGEPILYTSEDILTDCLLLEDSTGRELYDSVTKLATKLRVKEIVTVPVMENQTRTDTGGNTLELLGLIVNLTDYNVGADKGGAVNMFDDFDIDYNAQKFLIETRCSGALIKPYSAIALEIEAAAG
ncbi:MAG: phage major capsid protein [Eubacterium sp.]|jgi:HK97 family phage prohead protease|nr:phage major capsid protein [Eubacterium sp.]